MAPETALCRAPFGLPSEHNVVLPGVRVFSSQCKGPLLTFLPLVFPRFAIAKSRAFGRENRYPNFSFS